MSSWHSYPSIYNVGHRILRDFFTLPVYAEEKVDGSQFSFGKFLTPVPDPHHGQSGYMEEELKVRSKGAVFDINYPPKMFTKACETVKSLAPVLQVGWTYRAEFLDKPKHNALAYDRVPKGNLILFDVAREEEDYLSYEEKKAEGDRLGLEVVPILYAGLLATPNDVRALFNTQSILGGQKIEGVVFKQVQPTLFGPDKKILLAKFVSEAFKEVHKQAWGESNPTSGDFIEKVIYAYGTAARWNKAIIHLRESGELENSPRDIGKLIASIPHDIHKECAEDIKDLLFKHFWKQIARGVTRGFPEYYKNLLLEAQFHDSLASPDQRSPDATLPVAGSETHPGDPGLDTGSVQGSHGVLPPGGDPESGLG